MMSRATASISCTAVGFLALVVALQGQNVNWQPPNEAGQGQTPVMPVYQEPHHRQLFQHGSIRIIDLQIPPGDTSWFHMHDAPVFYLTTADAQTRTQIFGEEWGAGRGRGAAPAGRGGPGGPAGAPAAPGVAPAGAAPVASPAAPPAAPAAAPPAAAPRAGGPPAAGAAPRFRPRLFSDLSYAERAVTHRIQNVGNGLYRAIGVINETAGGDETVTEAAAGFNDKAEMSNKWFRIHRIALAPGEKTSAHQHKAAVVVLQDTAGKGIATGPMAFELNEPGQWAFFDTGVSHEIRNTGTEKMEVIEVEVRSK